MCLKISILFFFSHGNEQIRVDPCWLLFILSKPPAEWRFVGLLMCNANVFTTFFLPYRTTTSQKIRYPFELYLHKSFSRAKGFTCVWLRNVSLWTADTVRVRWWFTARRSCTSLYNETGLISPSAR